MSHLNFWILAFYTNFVQLKVTCLTARFRFSKFLMLNATFWAIFKHCVTEWTWTEKLQNFVCPFSDIFSWNPSQGLRWNSTKNCLCRASVIEDYWSLYYETPCNCNATRVCIWNFGHPNISQPHERQKQPSCKWQCHDMFMSQLW